jgi:phosphatidylserine/phosphatidylglycerophosphate/cardiolipin synthase-like enzyme
MADTSQTEVCKRGHGVQNIKADFYIGINAGKKLKGSIDNAKESIKILSPYLSESEISELEKMRTKFINEDKKVRFSIITSASDKDTNPSHREALRKLVVKVNKNYETTFNTVFVYDNSVHAKLYIIDDKIAYGGSLNFTYKGLFSNFETCTTIFDEKSVKELSDYFDKFFISRLYPVMDANEVGRMIEKFDKENKK